MLHEPHHLEDIMCPILCMFPVVDHSFTSMECERFFSITFVAIFFHAIQSELEQIGYVGEDVCVCICVE